MASINISKIQKKEVEDRSQNSEAGILAPDFYDLTSAIYHQFAGSVFLEEGSFFW
jgi:hypothetical protein